MAITNAFRSAVATGNVISIRIMMKDSMLVDPSFNEFNDMEQYTRTMSGLYDDHDGRALDGDQSNWNVDYMNKIMVQVVGNFSHERIAHLKQIVRYLRPVASRPASSASSSGSSTTSGRVGGSSSGNGSGGGSYSTNRPSYSRPVQATRPSNRQLQWIDSRNSQLRTTRVVVGAIAGGVIVGTVTAIAGGSFIAGAAVGAVVAGMVVWAATNRR